LARVEAITRADAVNSTFTHIRRISILEIIC
jgi:hypothetical protein